MKSYRSENISELIANIESTIKGASFLDNDGNAILIEDSKDVAKKKKETRTGISFVAKNEKQIALVKLSEVQTKDTEFILSASDIKMLALNSSSSIGDYVAAISGSKKYGEMTSSYLAAIIIQSILSTTKLPDSSPDSSSDKSNSITK